MARSSVGGARTASQPFSSARFSSSKSAAPPPPSRRKSKGKGKAKVDAEAAPTKLARRRAKDDIVGNDVYTFEEGPSKRLRTDDDRFKLSREENALAGGSRREDDEVDPEDSDDDMAARIRQAALKIAGHEALDLGDDESEIDSDAAWDEEGSDDERWGGAFEKWKKNGKSKKAVKAKQQKAKEVRSFLEPDLRTSLTVPLV
jgi:U3 small nucleolar RNA-associated protein 14